MDHSSTNKIPCKESNVSNTLDRCCCALLSAGFQFISHRIITSRRFHKCSSEALWCSFKCSASRQFSFFRMKPLHTLCNRNDNNCQWSVFMQMQFLMLQHGIMARGLFTHKVRWNMKEVLFMALQLRRDIKAE